MKNICYYASENSDYDIQKFYTLNIEETINTFVGDKKIAERFVKNVATKGYDYFEGTDDLSGDKFFIGIARDNYWRKLRQKLNAKYNNVVKSKQQDKFICF